MKSMSVASKKIEIYKFTMKASAESRILEIAIRGNINFISEAVEADIVAAPMMLLLCWCSGASILHI
jgi:hypothetical protein